MDDNNNNYWIISDISSEMWYTCGIVCIFPTNFVTIKAQKIGFHIQEQWILQIHSKWIS